MTELKELFEWLEERAILFIMMQGAFLTAGAIWYELAMRALG